MKGVATDIGTIHFVGIGGIGMSGIAEVMHNLGYSVQGSDLAEGATVQALRAKGIAVHIGHSPDNLGDVDLAKVGDGEPGFLANLAGGRFREPFAELDVAAGKAPQALQWRPTTPHEEHPAFVPDESTDAERRTGRRLVACHHSEPYLVTAAGRRAPENVRPLCIDGR